MQISTKSNKAENVTKLNQWGGVRNNEQQSNQGSRGFAGKTPDQLGSDLSNEQIRTFKGFTPNRGGIDYGLGSADGNENPMGFKQDSKPKAYKKTRV